MGRRGCVCLSYRPRASCVPPYPAACPCATRRRRAARAWAWAGVLGCAGERVDASACRVALTLRGRGRADVSPRRHAACACVGGRRAGEGAWGERACRAHVWACAGRRVVPVHSCACRRGAVACTPGWDWGLQTEELAKNEKKDSHLGGVGIQGEALEALSG